MSDKRVLCVYHGNCADGFGAAWVVRRALGEKNVEYFPGVYQDPPPNVEGRDLIVVDFSYKRPVMEKLLDESNRILWIDHHATALEDLKELESARLTKHVGMERSGAMLAWDYFFQGETPPKLLLHIEDRDLWQFKIPRTREVQATVFSHPYDFKTWDNLMLTNPEILAMEGEAIERKHFKDIAELVGVMKRFMYIGGHLVPTATLPYTLTSDAGHLMAKGEPFAACYWATPDGWVFSLRSQEDGMDVSKIAAMYGGGGHKHAAGFRVPLHALIPTGVILEVTKP